MLQILVLPRLLLNPASVCIMFRKTTPLMSNVFQMNKFIGSSRSILAISKRFAGRPFSQTVEDDHSSSSVQIKEEFIPKSDHELKALNREGFFDNSIALTGITGQCHYSVDSEDVVHAIRMPVYYKVSGRKRMIMATAVRSDLINFLLHNMGEGVKICVRGTLGRPNSITNLTLNAKHVEILSSGTSDDYE